MKTTGTAAWRVLLLLFMVITGFLIPALPAGTGPPLPGRAPVLDDALEQSHEAYAKVTGYTCLVHRKERIDGKIIEENNIVMKFRKPFSVYMRWTEGPRKGAEAIFSRGAYDDRLVVHLGGWKSFLTLRLDPMGSWAMRDNRHPITEAGIGHALDLIGANFRKARREGDGEIAYVGEEAVGDRRTDAFEAVLPPGKGYYGHVIRIFFDRESRLPVKLVVHGWEDELLESYVFTDLRLNVGLTKADFDLRNPAYKFS